MTVIAGVRRLSVCLVNARAHRGGLPTSRPLPKGATACTDCAAERGYTHTPCRHRHGEGYSGGDLSHPRTSLALKYKPCSHGAPLILRHVDRPFRPDSRHIEQTRSSHRALPPLTRALRTASRPHSQGGPDAAPDRLALSRTDRRRRELPQAPRLLCSEARRRAPSQDLRSSGRTCLKFTPRRLFTLRPLLRRRCSSSRHRPDHRRAAALARARARLRDVAMLLETNEGHHSVVLTAFATISVRVLTRRPNLTTTHTFTLSKPHRPPHTHTFTHTSAHNPKRRSCGGVGAGTRPGGLS